MKTTPMAILLGAVFLLLTVIQKANGQWSTNGGNIYYNDGGVGMGTATPTGRLQIAGAHANGIMADGNDRPGVGLTGWYPYVSMMAGGSSNQSHGAAILLGSFDNGTDGPHKHWTIGTSGQNSTFLDIGYHAGTDPNPHAGIRNHNGSTFMTILDNGNVGMGTLAPAERLDVAGNTRSGRFYNTALSGGNSKNSFQSFIANEPSLSTGWIAADFGGNGSEDKVVMGSGFGGRAILGAHNSSLTAWANLFMNPDGTGNVIIGKTTQANASYKLDVAGQVRADKLVVNTNGADFVFGPSYRLEPLAGVEKYVRRNGHLQGFAPAAKMQKEGIEIGESQAKLLQKLEELTLYAIAQDKKQQEQQQLITEQAKVLKAQQELLARLQKKLEAMGPDPKQP